MRKVSWELILLYSALCGWRPGSLEDTLTDVYTVRRIGLWNFVSIQVRIINITAIDLR